MGDYKYKAFISYSHKDRKWTRWLHRRLETYPIPKNIIGNVTSAGPIPKRLKPIFRDREELSASNNLGEKIEAALAFSQSLIIICSPAAAKSKWVNQEILTFKRNNRDAQLFSVIVEGEPYASGMLGREEEECFPPALRYEVNSDGSLSDVPAEPLAADLRPHADGKRLGFLKLISGMIGVGLDEVVQRDMKRSRKRVTAITSGSLATVLVMGTLTGFALDARGEAEQRRVAAEGQIEFMLTELRNEVEKVGRLDALNVVAKEAESYYIDYPPQKKEYKARARRARVFQYLGEIQIYFGNYREAEKYFNKAHKETQTLFNQAPQNADRVFDHAQSSFWLGYVLWETGDYISARPYFNDNIRLAETLKVLEKNSPRARKEITYAYSNLGTLLFKQGKPHEAYGLYLKSIPDFVSLATQPNNKKDTQIDLANAYGWLADVSQFVDTLNTSEEYRLKSQKIYESLIKDNSTDFEVLSGSVSVWISLSRIKIMQGDLKAATHYSDKGLKQAEEYYLRDPSNTSWGLTLMSLYLQKLEITLLENELQKSYSYLFKSKNLEANLINRLTKNSDSFRNLRLSQKYLNLCLLISEANREKALSLSKITDDFEKQSKVLGADLSNSYISYVLLKSVLQNDFSTTDKLVEEIYQDSKSVHPKFISNLLVYKNITKNNSKKSEGPTLQSNDYYSNDIFKTSMLKLKPKLQ